MSRLLKSFALASAALLVAASTYAAPAQAKPANPASTSATKKAAAAPKAKASSVTGTLDKYDSGANTIVVNTSKGTETLTLSSTSAVRMGAKKMTAADLSAHSGDRVKVRYTDQNGTKTVQSVQLEGKPAARQQARASTSTSKPAAKK